MNIYKSKNITVSIAHNYGIEKIYIELSSLCNFCCPMCFNNTFTEKMGVMSFQTLKEIKKQILTLPNLKEIILGGIGEPLIHPELDEVVAYIKKNKIRVTLNTNGALLKKHLDFLLNINIDRIILSCETDDTQHNNANFLKENLDIITKHNDKIAMKTKIALQMVLTKSNITELPNFIENILKRYKIDEIRLGNILAINQKMTDSILYMQKEPKEIDLARWIAYGKTKMVLPEFSLKTERHCDFVENNAIVIRWDGEICPCYRFLHTGKEVVNGRNKEIISNSFGNIENDSLLDIWNTKSYTYFRYKVENALFPCCTDCSLDTSCHYIESTQTDCWGNSPSCADCLWYRRILICP